MDGRNFMTCLILILGLVGRPSAQVDTTPDRVAWLISESAILLGQTTQPQRYDLTLDDAIQRALDRNLDIAVQRITPQVFDLSVAEQLAFYRPTVGFGLNSTSQRNPSQTQLDGGLITQTDSSNYDLSLTQPVQWGGGRGLKPSIASGRTRAPKKGAPSASALKQRHIVRQPSRMASRTSVVFTSLSLGTVPPAGEP